MKTYKLPAAYAAYITDGDDAGLFPEEILALEQFCKKEGIDIKDLGLLSPQQESVFAQTNDMHRAECAVLDYLYYTSNEVEMIRSAQNAFNAILEQKNIRIGIQMWPLVAFEYSMETGRQTAEIPSAEDCDLSELFMSIVDFYIDNSGLFEKADGIVYLAEGTDAWFGAYDRNIIRICTSEELALLSAMKHQGEVLRAENGGYKSIREECENGVYITQYKLDQEV